MSQVPLYLLYLLSSLLLSSLELSDTTIYEPWIRALLGTASHFCEVGTFCILWSGRATRGWGRGRRGAACAIRVARCISTCALHFGVWEIYIYIYILDISYIYIYIYIYLIYVYIERFICLPRDLSVYRIRHQWAKERVREWKRVDVEGGARPAWPDVYPPVLCAFEFAAYGGFRGWVFTLCIHQSRRCDTYVS